MGEEQLGIRIRADGVVEATNGIGLTGAAIEGLGKKAAAASPQIERTGNTAKQTAAAFRLLPAQITDVVTSLASGQPAWLVAIQQGGQIKDSFGGIVPAARALVGAVNPVTAALGLSGAAAVAVVLAYQQGRGESEAFARALILTGNAAGTNAGQMADQARAVSAVVGTQGAAAAAIAALAGTGAVASGQLVTAATLAVQMERTLGKSVQDTARDFASLAREPLAASLRLNQGTNYLTASVYKQIQALQVQGRTAEAAALAQSTYAAVMKERTDQVTQNLGGLERGWRFVTDAAKGTWDTMLGLGRAQTLQQQLETIDKQLQKAAQNRARFGIETYGEAAARQRQGELQEDQRLARRGAEMQAAQVAANNKGLEALSDGHQAAMARSDQAGQDLVLAQTGLALARRQAQYDRLYQRNEITAADYQKRLLQIELDGLAAQDKALQAQAGIEQRRQPKDQNELLTQKAAITQIETQRVAVQRQRVQLLAAEAAGERDIAPKSTDIGPSAGLRAFQAQDNSAVDQYVRDAKAAATGAASELLQTNRALSLELIRDDKARGMAQIAAEEEVIRRRLDLQSQSAEDQKRLTDELATWRLQREQQLTEQLKPEWQRMLEAWADTNRLMKDNFDSTVVAQLRNGEDAFVRFAQTGKLSLRSLFDEWVAQNARVMFRQAVSGGGGGGGWGGLFGSVLGLLGGGGGTGIVSGGSAESISGSYIQGRRVAGGPVQAGAAYLVGEGGPEVIRMGARGGYVVPNEALGGAGGGGGRSGRNVTFAPTINIDSRTDRAEVAALVQRAMQQSQADLLDKMDRGEI